MNVTVSSMPIEIRRRGLPFNGLRFAAPWTATMVRSAYRRMRRAGLSRDDARDAVWSVAFAAHLARPSFARGVAA